LEETKYVVAEADKYEVRLDDMVWGGLIAACKHKRSLPLARFITNELQTRKIDLSRASHISLIEMGRLAFEHEENEDNKTALAHFSMEM
jgi:hypothetical protein